MIIVQSLFSELLQKGSPVVDGDFIWLGRSVIGKEKDVSCVTDGKGPKKGERRRTGD
jgi:hypothetical protein